MPRPVAMKEGVGADRGCAAETWVSAMPEDRDQVLGFPEKQGT